MKRLLSTFINLILIIETTLDNYEIYFNALKKKVN